MKYQIDQSGKMSEALLRIEQTEKDTVIAYANGQKFAILIPRRLKRQIQEVFRLHGFTSLFIYFLFSVGVFYLLESLDKESDVTIDTEYPGKDKIIKEFVLSLLEENGRPKHHLRVARIGNRPPAHYRILTLKEFIKALKKTDGRLRECLSTLVDAQTRSVKKIYHKRRGNVKIKN